MLFHMKLAPSLRRNRCALKRKTPGLHLLRIAKDNDLLGTVKNWGYGGKVNLRGFINNDDIKKIWSAGEYPSDIVRSHNPNGKDL